MRSLRNAAKKVALFSRRMRSVRPAMAMQDFGHQSAPARRPAVEAGHVRFRPGFIDEDQTREIDPLLMPSPAEAMALYIRAILLTRDDRLF